jgi:hypothetical protein
VARLPWNRNHSTAVALVPSSEAARTRSLQARVARKSQDPLGTGHEVLLAALDYCQHHLVHLRLQRLLVWYLRHDDREQLARRGPALVEELGMEHTHQFLLHPWLSCWSLRRGFEINGAKENALHWCYAAGHHWIHHGGLLSMAFRAQEHWRLRCCVWSLPHAGRVRTWR